MTYTHHEFLQTMAAALRKRKFNPQSTENKEQRNDESLLGPACKSLGAELCIVQPRMSTRWHCDIHFSLVDQKNKKERKIKQTLGAMHNR